MHTSNKGFSLIEILVGLTIGFLGMIVIMQVFSVTESGKLTTTSGGDAQQNAALSLHTLERDLRMAGYGLNAIPGLMGCKINAYNSDRTPQNFDFLLTAVVIEQGVSNAPDTLTITYSNSDMGSAPASIIQNMPSPAAVYKVNNRFGFNPGDLIVAAEEGKDCTLAQTTDVPGGGQSDNVIHNSGNYTPPGGGKQPAIYNKPSGLGTAYTTKAKLYNLGPVPGSNIYSIGPLPDSAFAATCNNQPMCSNALVVTSNFTGESELVASNVIDLQAEYGTDANGDGMIGATEYGTATPADWSKVLSVRFGVVARSSKREPTEVTTTVPAWIAGDFQHISNDGDWKHYRYRVFETTAMLRNMLWKP